MAFELLHRCFGMVLVRDEMQIEYTSQQGGIIDFLGTVHGTAVGVSVTRALPRGWQDTRPYSPPCDLRRGRTMTGAEERDCQLYYLVLRKLAGLSTALARVSQPNAWEVSLLFIWCPSLPIAQSVSRIALVMQESTVYRALCLRPTVMVVCHSALTTPVGSSDLYSD